MNRMMCSECYQECDIEEHNHGVGGSYYGSSYAWHDDIVIGTSCCESRHVYIVPTAKIESFHRYMRIHGGEPDKGTHHIDETLENHSIYRETI